MADEESLEFFSYFHIYY